MSSKRIQQEQEHVTRLYQRLDQMYRQSADFLANALRDSDGTPGGLTERDIAAAKHTERLTAYSAAEYGLCFGRLDFRRDEPQTTPLHIGRIGIYDEDYEPLLVDWRAPSARPFYLATAADPQGISRRRHIRISKRIVTNVDDELLDIDAASDSVSSSHTSMPLTGEATLMAALNADRTGRMSDIVETIQIEQDRIIRAHHQGALVVQGGPGTGKTAVALHRAAYLMYTHRDRLAHSGVLVIGPNPTFLSYIGHVLPALGETAVNLSTIGSLLPGIDTAQVDAPLAASTKGSIEMTQVLMAAIRNRQTLPDGPHPFTFDGADLALDRSTAMQARRRARASRRPHNLARDIFARQLILGLAEQYADKVGENVLGGQRLLDREDLADVQREMHTDPAIDKLIDTYWPILTPTALMADFFTNQHQIDAAATGFPEAARRSLYRSDGSAWTVSDIPLLDEVADLLGDDDRTARLRAQSERAADIDYAQGVLDIIEGSRSADFEDDAEEEILSAADLIDASQLADRQEHRQFQSVAERAAGDREWTYGHVIVDEAQELSAMAWRSVMRRTPNRSMTLVGDLAQTGDPAGASSWSEVLQPYLGDRWQLEFLTVNYRTPSEITAIADRLLTRINPDAAAPTSVRSTGHSPWQQETSQIMLPQAVQAETKREMDLLNAGRLAILAPEHLLESIRAAMINWTTPGQPDLESTVVVLGVTEAKGLEFDSVIVVDPAGIINESSRGLNNLYVALTRPTQRLGIIHCGDLPPELADVAVGP